MLVFQARKARHPFNLSRNASYWTQPEFRLTCCCSHRRRSSEIPSSLWVRSCSDPCTVRSSSCYLRNLQQTMASSPDWASATSFSQLRRICKKYFIESHSDSLRVKCMTTIEFIDHNATYLIRCLFLWGPSSCPSLAFRFREPTSGLPKLEDDNLGNISSNFRLSYGSYSRLLQVSWP